jgi:PAS domain S-box-containing protein
MLNLAELIQSWFISNLDIVFFVYGLAFIIMGIAITVQPKKNSDFKLADILWLLACFAIIHGISEFLDMWAIIKGKNPSLATARWIILSISFLYLFEFSRQLFRLTAQKSYWRKAFSKLTGAWLVSCIIIIILSYFIFSVDLRNILVRYLLCFPGGLLIALSLKLYYQEMNKVLKPLKVKKYFFWVGFAFFAYAFLSGLVVPKGTLFPSNWLNADSFLLLVHIPVQVFRACCALISAAGVCGILVIFNWEKTRRIEESLAINQGITDGIDESIMLIDNDYKILWENKKQKELFGEAVGGYCYQATHHINSPCQGPHDICPISETKTTGKVSTVVHQHVDKKGNERYVEVSAYPIRNAQGEIIESVHISRDVTDRINSENEIKENYEIQNGINSLLRFSLKNISLNELLNNALDIILAIPGLSFKSTGSIFLVKDNPEVLVLEAQRGFSDAHKLACAIVPFGKCICGKAALNKEKRFVDCIDENHEIRYDGMPPHGHYCVPIVFGDKVIGILNLLGVLNMYVEESHPYNQREEELICALADVLAGIIVRKQAEGKLESAYNKLKVTEMQLVQAAKMAGIGQLAAGVAHEINNPLTGVLNNIQLVKMEIAQKKDFNLEDFKEVIDAVEESALRCRKIIRSLLDFSHSARGPFQFLSLNNTIEKAIGFIEQQVESENILIKKQLQPDLPLILGGSQLLEQLILDIISNARWAIQMKSPEEGGLITIKSKYEPEKRIVLLSISDTGIGIPKENLGKIFEPFFTTKPVGEGTGLGLSIAYSIIKQHNGTIEVESQLDKGATINISFPVMEK